jgi:hypothetical protein
MGLGRRDEIGEKGEVAWERGTGAGRHSSPRKTGSQAPSRA